MGISILHLRLEGPLQSWGEHSKFYFRDSAREPTKSGVIGLIACAIGYPRYDPDIKNLDSRLHMAVRVEREGVILNEFQTIDSGYITAKRGLESKGIIRTKQYLQDASFLVLLVGKKSLLDTIEEALSDPKWPYYLGRKCCSPSMPLFLDRSTCYSSLEDALSEVPYSCPYFIPTHKRTHDLQLKLRCIIGDPYGPIKRLGAIQTNKSRMYGIRRVREFWVSLVLPALETAEDLNIKKEKHELPDTSTTEVN